MWRSIALLPAVVLVALPLYAQADEDTTSDEEEMDELVVSARATVTVDHLAELSATVLDRELIDEVQANHPNEIFSQIPGVWISRGSGHEHLAAIRSGVVTGAGACGTYLLLENGIPIRPPSFCNVNGLFELNTEQASAIEVIRGPASSRYGGNGLHGIINAITMAYNDENSLTWQIGSNAQSQLRLRLGNTLGGLAAYATRTNGWRDDTGFDQQKLNAQIQQQLGLWRGTHTLSLSSLSQETGGYVVGLNAYKDDSSRFSNPNPEAFRDAQSVRYASHWRNGNLMVSPYLRYSSMEFLMHFLPGQPLESNSQRSGGVLVHWEREIDQLAVSLGIQAEFVNAQLSEVQSAPTVGSAFLVATRPIGTHYDFAVNASHIGVFHDGRIPLNDAVVLKYRIRLESANYDYDNRHIDGNTRDDGSNCGFGGCLYTRPADHKDDFLDYAMQVGFESAVGADTFVYGLLGSGFRPPQITELYRLQSGQTFADIDSERLDAAEIGVNRQSSRSAIQLAAYTERGRNLIIRDANGFNQSGGRVNSSGIELRMRYALTARNVVHLTQSIARHRYDFTQNLAAREVITLGHEVDTAPRHLGSIQWRMHLSDTATSTLEVVRIGEYFMDAANTMTYPGHVVVNWHGRWALSDAWEVQGHLRNVLDEKYADRADLAFGKVRYFPAMPRNVQLGIKRYF